MYQNEQEHVDLGAIFNFGSSLSPLFFFVHRQLLTSGEWCSDFTAVAHFNSLNSFSVYS